MASVKVFGSPASAEVARVLACLFEKDIEFQLVRVDTYRGAKRMPDYLKLQPRGEALTFEAGRSTLVESRKICRHVIDTYPDLGNRDLLGAGAVERAAIEQWLQAEERSFDGPTAELVFSLAFLPESFNWKEDKAAAAAAKLAAKENEKKAEEMRASARRNKRELEEVLDIYEQRLQEARYLAGDKFTLADLSHLPNGHRLATDARSRPLFTSRKNVSRWWADISSRPSWRRVVDLQRQPPPLV